MTTQLSWRWLCCESPARSSSWRSSRLSSSHSAPNLHLLLVLRPRPPRKRAPRRAAKPPVPAPRARPSRRRAATCRASHRRASRGRSRRAGSACRRPASCSSTRRSRRTCRRRSHSSSSDSHSSRGTRPRRIRRSRCLNLSVSSATAACRCLLRVSVHLKFEPNRRYLTILFVMECTILWFEIESVVRSKSQRCPACTRRKPSGSWPPPRCSASRASSRGSLSRTSSRRSSWRRCSCSRWPAPRRCRRASGASRPRRRPAAAAAVAACVFCGRAQSQDASDAGADLGGEAIGCLVELLSKRFVPRQFDQFVALSLQFASALLSKLLVSLPQQGTTLVAAIDDAFVERLIEFVRLFIETHLARLNPLANEAFLDFLNVLYRFAFSLRSFSHLCSCLGAFAFVLEFVFGGDQAATSSVASPAVAMTLTKYKIAFQTIASDILRKIELRSNQAELELLDDDSLEDNNRTEWQGVLAECFDLLVKVAERMPAEMLTQIAKHIGECSWLFSRSRAQLVLSPSCLVLLDIAEHEASHRQRWGLLESAALRAARFDFVAAATRRARRASALRLQRALFRRVRAVLGGASRTRHADRSLQYLNRLFALSLPSDSEVSREDFVKLHAQAILTLGEFSRWLSLYSARLCEPLPPPFHLIEFTTDSWIAGDASPQQPAARVPSRPPPLPPLRKSSTCLSTASLLTAASLSLHHRRTTRSLSVSFPCLFHHPYLPKCERN